MNQLDFNRHLIRQRNAEILRDGWKLWLKEWLRVNLRLRSGRSRSTNLTLQGVLSPLRGVGFSD